MTLRRRVLELERRTAQAEPGGWWVPPIIEQRPGEDIDAKLEAVRCEAVAAGWKPESGQVYVVIVELGEP